MGKTKEESLARWVAETVEDLYMHSKYGEPQIHILSPPRSTATISVYLNCMNVARRLLKRISDDSMCSLRAIYSFQSAAWEDTPFAIELIAKACGWTAPIIDNDTEKK